MWHWIVEYWRSRLAGYQAALDDDPVAANAWLLRIRLRILEFLVHRYSDPDSAPRPVVLPLRARLITLKPTFCRVEPSPDHGPRTRSNLGSRLQSVHDANVESAPSKRWWLW
ncbi:hypothetical protein PHYC_00387 [Phycisphaerales bacterium]|nr:hypothetical protein PHYC_00387 [Phycisphaerales bacterium]